MVKLEAGKLMHSVKKSCETIHLNKLEQNAKIHNHKTRHAPRLNYFVSRKRIRLLS